MADALDLGSSTYSVRVQVPYSPPYAGVAKWQTQGTLAEALKICSVCLIKLLIIRN